MKKKLMSGFLAFCMLAAMAPAAMATAPNPNATVGSDDYKESPDTTTYPNAVWTDTVSKGAKQSDVLWANMVDGPTKLNDLSVNTNSMFKDVDLITDPGIKTTPVTDLSSYTGYDAVFDVTLTGKDLLRHKNGSGGVGNWIGIAVPKGSGSDNKYTWSYGVSEKDFDADMKRLNPISCAFNTTATHYYPNTASQLSDEAATHATMYWDVSSNNEIGIDSSATSRDVYSDGAHGFAIVEETLKEGDKRGKAGDLYHTLYNVDFSDVTIKQFDVKIADEALSLDSTTVNALTGLSDLKFKLSSNKTDLKIPDTPADESIVLTVKNNANVEWTFKNGVTKNAKLGVLNYNKGVITLGDMPTDAINNGNSGKDLFVGSEITIDAWADGNHTVSVDGQGFVDVFASDVAVEETVEGSDTPVKKPGLVKHGARLGDTDDAGTDTDKTITLKVNTAGDAKSVFLPNTLESVTIGDTALEAGTDYDYELSDNKTGTITFHDKTVDGKLKELRATGDIKISMKIESRQLANVTDTTNLAFVDENGKEVTIGTLIAGAKFSDLSPLTLKVKEGKEKELPKNITKITMGKDTVLEEGTDYVYNASTGTITFKGEKTLNDDLTIDATAADKNVSVKKITVTDAENLKVTPDEVTLGASVPTKITLAIQPDKVGKYALPAKINSITVEGKPLEAGNKWMYNSGNGEITITPAATDKVLTTDIVIDAKAVAQATVELVDNNNCLELTPLAIEEGSLANTSLTLSVKKDVTAFGLPKTIEITTTSGGKTTDVPKEEYRYNPEDGTIIFNKTGVTTTVNPGDVLTVKADARDIEAPVIVNGEQTVSEKEKFAVEFSCAKDIKWYALAQAADAEEPTIATIKEKGISDDLTGGEKASVESSQFTGLEVKPGTAYKVWVVGTSKSDIDSEKPVAIDVKTAAQSTTTTITKVLGQAVEWNSSKEASIEVDASQTAKLTLDDIELADATAKKTFSGTAEAEIPLNAGEVKKILISVTSESGMIDTYTLNVTCPAAVNSAPKIEGDAVQATVPEDTADLVDKAADSGSGLVISATTEDADDKKVDQAEVTIPPTVAEKIGETKDAEKPVDTTIKTPQLDITVPAEVMSTAAEALKNDPAAAGKNLKLSVRKAKDTSLPQGTMGSTYDVKFTYTDAKDDHAIDVTTNKEITLSFKRNFSLIKDNPKNPIILVYVDPTKTDPKEKYQILEKAVLTENTIDYKTTHLSIYSQMNRDTLKSLGLEVQPIPDISPNTQTTAVNTWISATGAQPNHYVWFQVAGTGEDAGQNFNAIVSVDAEGKSGRVSTNILTGTIRATEFEMDPTIGSAGTPIDKEFATSGDIAIDFK